MAMIDQLLQFLEADTVFTSKAEADSSPTQSGVGTSSQLNVRVWWD